MSFSWMSLRARRAQRRPATRNTLRPTLEILEDRFAPASLQVAGTGGFAATTSDNNSPVITTDVTSGSVSEGSAASSTGVVHLVASVGNSAGTIAFSGHVGGDTSAYSGMIEGGTVSDTSIGDISAPVTLKIVAGPGDDPNSAVQVTLQSTITDDTAEGGSLGTSTGSVAYSVDASYGNSDFFLLGGTHALPAGSVGPAGDELFSDKGTAQTFTAHFGDTIDLSAIYQTTYSVNSAALTAGTTLTISYSFAAAPKLQVSTPDSIQPNGPVFGPYLPGVGINVPFTVTANDPNHLIASVRWSIDGGASSAAIGKNGTWTFSYNPGTLKPGKPHTLRVTGYDKSGKPVSNSGPLTLDLQTQPLTYQAEVAYPGGPFQRVQAVRFMEGVPLKGLTFRGAIGGLPSYYLHTNLAVTLGTQPETIKTTIAGSDLDFSFTANGATLPVGNNVALTARLGAQPLASLSSAALTPQTVLTIAEPAWLQSGKASFSPQDGAYHFDHVTPQLINLSIPSPPVHTGVPALDSELAGLTTFAKLTPDLSAVVPLTLSTNPSVTANKLTAQVQLLGRPIVQQAIYLPGQISSGGTLDPRTLDPVGVYVRLATQSLGTQTLFNKTFSVHFPVADPVLGITATLGLELTNVLSYSAGIALRAAPNHQLQLDPAGTFFTASTSMKGKAEVDVKASILAGWFELDLAKVFVHADLEVTGTASFGGPITNPALSAASSASATLSGDYAYDVLVEKKGTTNPQDEKSNPTFGPVQLFKL